MNSPMVSVVIPVRNGAPWIEEQLTALAQQDFTGLWEVIVADNGSTDDTAAVVAAFTPQMPVPLRLVDASRHRGPSHARNVGVEASEAEIIAFCDCDDHVAPGWLTAAVAALQGADLVVGQNRELRRPLDVASPVLPTSGLLPRAWGKGFVTCNLAIRRQVLLELGGFNEALPSYGYEDMDLALRASLSGVTMTSSTDMVVFFRRTESSRATTRKVWQSARSQTVMWSQYPEVFQPPFTPLQAFVHVLMLPRDVLASQLWKTPRPLAREALTRCGRLFGRLEVAVGRHAARPLLLAQVEEASPRIALAHDYFTQRGGAERVAMAFTDIFPGAPLYTALYEPESTYPELAAVDLRTGPLNKVSLIRRKFRWGLPFFGWAFDHTPIEDADVVLVSTTAFAHGIRTDARKIVYCHSPARFIYLIDEYLGRPWWQTPMGWALMAFRPMLRRWDQKAARSADVYLCNSTLVRERIKRVYGIDAQVVHPPAALDPQASQEDLPELADWPDHHLLVGRLLPYKNIDKAIEAFRQLPDQRLLVVGRGPLKERLQAILPPNVRMVEGISDAQLRRAYATAKAVVATSFEDFGLTPVEGFAFGVPTIALRAGGYLDTVVDGKTGYFFDEPTPEAIAAAVTKLAAQPLDRDAILEHGQRFSPETFEQQVREIVSMRRPS